MSPSSAAPRLAFIGPALGKHEGWVTTQGEILAGLFAAEAPVHISSTELSPLRRGLDHAIDLLRWRKEVDIAIISVFSGRGFALAEEAIACARLAGMATVAWLHGGNLPTFGLSHPTWTRRVLRGADAVVSPSSYLDRWARGYAWPCHVIPNVLDLDAYHHRVRPHPAPRLLWMRTFQDLYDPGCALEVLASLRGGGLDATLTMAGQDKGLLEATRRQARELEVDPWVEFPGFVSGPDKADLLDRHDIFLNTNLVDNAPVTVLEAAASGLAVVSTDVGGIPDLLAEGRSAVLVPPGDAERMAGAVRHVLGDPALFARITSGGRAVAEASGWPAVRQRWLDVFASAPVTPRRRR